jgi:hypothetical protein
MNGHHPTHRFTRVIDSEVIGQVPSLAGAKAVARGRHFARQALELNSGIMTTTVLTAAPAMNNNADLVTRGRDYGVATESPSGLPRGAVKPGRSASTTLWYSGWSAMKSATKLQ